MEALENEANDDVERRGDTLTAKHCSPLLSNCVTASLSVGEAQRGELAAISGTSALGGIAGALLGAALCLLRRRSRSMHRQLRRAVAEERLHLAYQPIVNLSDGKIVGAEALARWTTDDGSSVEPEVFIKVAEEHGFIGSITNFVLRRALKEFREVFEKIPGFHLNINIAAADLVDPKFLPMLGQVVSEAKVRPSNLVLEVTESSTASRDDAMESIRSLRERGYGIYIDDFGTGYSNLSYLLYLSVDKIKIDRAFVRAIGSESVTVAILPQIIAMARSMNLGVVVEGIESERQAHYFSSDDVKVDAQGFLFGRPIPATEFLKLVGLAGDRPEIEGNPEAAAVPGPWGRLASEVQAAIVR
jgi:sensor c-di-GMP phosphodiesterase-like protein